MMGFFKRFMTSFCEACLRKKSIIETSTTVTELQRCLTTLDMTFIGIGSTLGAGIYVVTGEVARYKAGPAIVVSFFIAAFASLLSGLCYAELGARIPKAGSAYLYCYITMGELFGFFIGWNMVLEYLIGACSIVRGLSAYIDSFTSGAIKNATISAFGEIHNPYFSSYFDFVSVAFSILFTILLSLGVKNSARFNNICVLVNAITIVSVIIAGLFYVDGKNWENFAPFGVSGVFAGAATCFFSFVGFDVIATTSEESKNPGRAIPISMTCTIVVCFLSYFGVSAVVTLMVPYYQLNPTAAVAASFYQRGLKGMGYLISTGAVTGMMGCSIISFMPLPRLLYALSQDGMIPQFFSRVNKTTNVPVIGTVISGIFIALLSALLDLDALVEMLSIGTLLAYSFVDICILILRYEVRSGSQNRTTNRNSDEEPLLSNSGKTNPTGISNFKSLRKENTLLNLNIVLIIIEMLLINVILTKFASDLHPVVLAIVLVVLIISLVSSVVLLSRRASNEDDLSFKVPFVPLVPVLALFFNIYLILSLSKATFYRLIVWVIIGTFIYLGYSMHNSVEKPDSGESSSTSPLLEKPSSTISPYNDENQEEPIQMKTIKKQD